MKDGRSSVPFNGVKVFSATMAEQRAHLGEHITEWLRARPNVEVCDTIVTQSSDSAFHCLAFTIFYWENLDGTQR